MPEFTVAKYRLGYPDAKQMYIGSFDQFVKCMKQVSRTNKEVSRGGSRFLNIADINKS